MQVLYVKDNAIQCGKCMHSIKHDNFYNFYIFRVAKDRMKCTWTKANKLHTYMDCIQKKL